MGGSAESDGEGSRPGLGPAPMPSSPVRSEEVGASAADGGDDHHQGGAQLQTTLLTSLESNMATLPRSNTTTSSPSGKVGFVHSDSGGGLVELTSLFAPRYESTETLRTGNLSDQRPRHSPTSSSERLIEMSEVKEGYHALDTLKMNNRKSFVGIGLVEIDEVPESDRSPSRQSTSWHSNVSAGYERVNSEGDDEPAPADDDETSSPLYRSETASEDGRDGDGPLRPSPESDDAFPTGVAAITDRLFLRNEHLLRSASRLGESAERIGKRSRTVWGLMTKRLSTVGRRSVGAESDLGSIREEDDDEDDDPVSSTLGFSTVYDAPLALESATCHFLTSTIATPHHKSRV